ncbi:hypothetical protein HYPSUDRAFT_632444 [Hypholoma sublateritium FD-334 SS-4]|uniref:Uncharacterized protein n=1 Tax=Hypholoma sublateritium (strain FD-334 SS-4) TaxID=945553 RepID=A0A0D2PKV7_HYPSF|nr:hypothetical protein HYPSUDRAFT_632444 [Hypholoma sublateritium FD-334 SS-4]
MGISFRVLPPRRLMILVPSSSLPNTALLGARVMLPTCIVMPSVGFILSSMATRWTARLLIWTVLNTLGYHRGPLNSPQYCHVSYPHHKATCKS